MENLSLIGKDSRLEKHNQYRGVMNKATFLPRNLSMWLVEQIGNPFFPSQIESIKNSMLNITTYDETSFTNPDWSGSHGRHRDVGRNYALNYYFSLGGPHTKIQWFSDDHKNILAEANPTAERWVLLKVDTIHAVRQIEPEEQRVFVSVGLLVDEPAEDFFKILLSQ
jgi:hypothetical protein